MRYRRRENPATTRTLLHHLRLALLCLSLCEIASATTRFNALSSPLLDLLPGGGATATTASTPDDPTLDMPIRVAYQGVPGAYSEKATRELLGQKVIAVGRPSFEDCFRAVTSMECDYACLPIENSLGGSIHET